MNYNLVLIGFLSILIISCNNDKRKSDLISNFEKRNSEIIDLKNYFDKIVPKKFSVNIRYESSNVVNLEVYEKPNDTLKKELLFRKWDINVYDYIEKPQTEYEKKYHGKTNSLELVKSKLNWTDKTFRKLYTKLESAECIGISKWKLTNIEYGYNGLGVYSYKIFDHNLDKKEIEKFNDGCINVFYKNNVVLSFGGGAIGMQCFEDYKQK